LGAGAWRRSWLRSGGGRSVGEGRRRLTAGEESAEWATHSGWGAEEGEWIGAEADAEEREGVG